MKVSLTGAAETTLATLCARAVDARSPHPMLGDRTAAEILDRLDYDFSGLRIQPATAIGVALRTRFFDRWTRRFLDAHREATVLHLGCGLDGRVQRLDPGPGVRWFDVDQPEVIELRDQLYPPRPNSRTLGASVVEEGWLAEIPTDRPVLVLGEGLAMYLGADDGPRMLRAVVARFPLGGEIVFDSYSRATVRMSGPLPVMRQTGAQMRWGVDDPREVPREVPGLRLVESVKAYDTADPGDHRRLPLGLRLRLLLDTRVLAKLPISRGVGHISRFAFP
ncbi:class I SAM-dependent methyltransferase [Micromonospora rubida]|uniref:class I SAM-dependent methyltransferase n=1 Tax=Micromonospora rubida TaxID=2697657 RepID=UPI001378BAF4|nr:class I SAM-dependent methyltransferase [Micromonospora rubida]NBE80066.1 class I SAM-dependent methyltransferase [Micromonospora rubida]